LSDPAAVSARPAPPTAETRPSPAAEAKGGERVPAWRYLPAIGALLVTVWFLGFLGPVAEGERLELVLSWVPALGIEFALLLDGLSLTFALLIAGIGAICLLYAASYHVGDRRLGSLLLIMSLFGVSMLGLVLADDAITLFVFWELTTITSFLLIGFDHEKRAARGAALQALLVTTMGGLGLLAALIVMSFITGSYRISEMNAAGDLLRGDALYPLVFWLVAFGCFTKSAQWPFHFWLPNAMAAPTAVSAYLHSATMVKGGVFLLARFSPALGGTELWAWTLTLVGALTMVLSSVWALRQTDLKLMLAFTTVMGLGAITMLLGSANPWGITAAMTFILVHAFYKAALFLSVGMIDKGAGTREYPQLGGLARAMPLTTAIIALAALSMAGMAPFFGFIGKELIYEAAHHAPVSVPLVTGAALAANAMMVACAGMVALRPFLGSVQRAPKDAPYDPGWGFWIGPALLAALGLVFGLAPYFVEHSLVAPMVWAVGGVEPPLHLTLWHGFTLALLLSLVTFVIGAALYFGLDRIRDGLIAAEPRVPETERWYDGFRDGGRRMAQRLTLLLQDGRMTTYLRMTFVAMALLIWGAVLVGLTTWPGLALPRTLIEWAIVGIIVASTIVVLRTDSRLTAITALGGVGSGIAVIFVLYGAVDVAMTQLFVEILVVVFLSIVMVRLPRSGVVPFRLGNALIATVLGIGMTLVLISVLGLPLDRKLTLYFEENSVPVALGHNIVNVILVDFRGFDTMGEISVIVIAGIAAVAALRAGKAIVR
jgi:multicomponent Na+:H+ antiporter subunit A